MTDITREQLEEIEYCAKDSNGDDECPVCGRGYPSILDKPDELRHEPDCWIGKALKL